MKIKLFMLALVMLVSCSKNYSNNEVDKNEMNEEAITEVMEKASEVSEQTKAEVPKDKLKAEEKPVVQEPSVLPAGTILFIRTPKDIYAESFATGDHFFVELSKDISSKGKVLIPKGTIVQMDVVVSENKRRRSSQFAITVGGFIIDNFLQKVKTEIESR